MRYAIYTLVIWGSWLGVTHGEVKNVVRRGDFVNSRIRFDQEKRGHVAFIGGSITEMNGYRPMVCQDLLERFPHTQFTFTDAGIASTCSTTGAFRLARDVLSQGPVDLLFIEFAVNDDQDAAHSPENCLRGMEGIIRQALAHNPHMDIVITYFVNEPMLALLQEGKVPVSMATHERVAAHYHVTSSQHAREVAEQITAGTLTWQDYGGVHPAPRGNAIAARLIKELLTEAWSAPLPDNARPQPHPLPEPLDPTSYGHGRFLAPDQIALEQGWRHETPTWKEIPGQFRDRFGKEVLFCATERGAVLTYEFEGTGTGAYVLAGPDAGQLDVSIDGGSVRTVELYHRFSKGLHYPRTVMFATDLAPGKHRVQVKVSSEHAADSQGTAARVLNFVAN